MDIKTLATEMKTNAEAMPIDMAKMMVSVDRIAFPDELRRIESVDGFGAVQVQFSHDQLSEDKFIRHLSYRLLADIVPSAEMQEAFRIAFFGDEQNLLPLPSLHGHVIQLVKLEIKMKGRMK